MARYGDLTRRKVNGIFKRACNDFVPASCLADQELDKEMLDEDLELLEELPQHNAASDGLVDELAGDDGRVELLKTIPGIGNIFACSLPMK